MKYYSLNRKAPVTDFKSAVIQGIAPDRGLYFPSQIEPLSNNFWNNIGDLSREEAAFHCIQPFIGNQIPEDKLMEIIKETVDFEFPVIPINEKVSSLELFHGPTLAFKDVGARFMARSLGYFNQDSDVNTTILVATSGDTGGAVANGFLGVLGVDVVILYPKGKVSPVQESQLTTLGQNITALEVDGVFDDCQDMVKSAFLDPDVIQKRRLTSANSINVARWLPQMFYYVFAYQQLKDQYASLSFSVPSGNFGNICAGMMAHRLGMPVTHFIAANNSNDVVARYLQHGEYIDRPTIATISNAMDVSKPSNFVRIQELYDRDLASLKHKLYAYAFSDQDTKKAIKDLENQYQYIADPHGAVGYLAAIEHLQSHPDQHCVFLETAHPCKFSDVMEEVLGRPVPIPVKVAYLMQRKQEKIEISSYKELKDFLLA
ncbi:threonine synthase [Nonlabens xiamenensis]|uniref:threonine synthase n=1 Tax=Nonlabens xiamenensis TaxID=2341043 RepID=UPI000F6090E3|nr:threonine synthase [Nonlabens xiamenensis]